MSVLRTMTREIAEHLAPQLDREIEQYIAAQDEVIFASEHGWFKQVIDTIVDHIQQVPAGLPILCRRFETAQKIGDAHAALHLHLVLKPGLRPGDEGAGNIDGPYFTATPKPPRPHLAHTPHHT